MALNTQFSHCRDDGILFLCHVLIIEDEPLIALDLEDLLGSHGALTFSFAETQDDAIAACRVRSPDFIISDVSLREGSGPLAVAEIRRELGTLPVIFVTATPETCIPCDQPGQVFRKPLDRDAIATAFREMAFKA